MKRSPEISAAKAAIERAEAEVKLGADLSFGMRHRAKPLTLAEAQHQQWVDKRLAEILCPRADDAAPVQCKEQPEAEAGSGA
jgi:hypothetical protein